MTPEGDAARPAREATRCAWCGSDPLCVRYHDEEWGVPVRDDRKLFEMLALESAQAGLAWITILRKREGYRRAFAGFDPRKVARFGEADVQALLQDAGIVRSGPKIRAAIHNARLFLEVQREFGAFADYAWSFVRGIPKRNRWTAPQQIPATTPESDAFSSDLKRRGFRFVGSTTVYACMQACGMVNDHTVDCFRHGQVERLPASNG